MNISDAEREIRGKIDACLRMMWRSDPEDVSILLALTSDSDIRVRRLALQALGWRQVPVALGLIIQHLHEDASPKVRATCAHALSHFDNDNSYAALVSALRDLDNLVAENAVISLSHNQSKQATASLLGVLRTGTFKMRLFACEGLVKWGVVSNDLLTVLEELYESPERIAYEEEIALSISVGIQFGDASDLISIHNLIEEVRKKLAVPTSNADEFQVG